MKRASLLLALGLAACQHDDGGAGALQLTLATPSTHDGAIVILVAGGPVSAIHPAAGLEVASITDSIGTHVTLVGDVGAGVIATLDVPDQARASRYVAVVEQVADRDAFTLQDAARYQITIAPAASGGALSPKAP